GELYIGGKGLGRGYLQRPEITAERFIPDAFSSEAGARLYRTGDRVRHQRDGRIEFLGRMDHQVKVRGFRVEVGEVEAALREHPLIREAVVEASREGVNSTRLIGYVVPEAGRSVKARELREYLKERLPEYMVPSLFMELEALPLNPSGKVDRRALPSLDHLVSGQETEMKLPQTMVEEVVAGIWAEVLGLEQVGVEENFFELGGHSLLATQMVSRVRQAFRAEVSLRWVFESPTVAGLSKRIEEGMRSGGELIAPPMTPVQRNQAMPLSFAQERLWFIEQMESGTGTYNIPAGVRLEGWLSTAALEQALREVVRRHEVLRTSFIETEGEPLQVIAETVGLGLDEVDLSGLEADEREAVTTKLSREESSRGFDLKKASLIRARLLRIAEQEQVLLLTMHHIVSDGWSGKLLIRETGSLYEGFTEGRPSGLRELQTQYADYAVWQREWLQGEALDRQISYWKEQLAGAPQVLDLPTDRPRPPVQTHRGAIESLVLSTTLSKQLKSLSQRNGCTMFMALLAAFKLLLSRHTGQLDIVVGAPIAGRSRSEVEEQIGLFLNTLTLRTDISGSPSFTELLNRVRKTALEAYAHQDVPFEMLLQALHPQRDLSRTPLFQVFFNMLNLPGATLELQ